MPSGGDIEAGRAFVRLFLKNDFSKKLAGALKAAGSQLQSFGRGTMMAGVKMAGAGAAIAAPLVLGLREFAKFDAKMGGVSTMLDNPDEFMPGFRQGIKDMAVEFGKSKDELATGLYDILSATVPPEQALERLAAATKLAAAGNAEVGDSTSVLNTLMDTYGDSFRDAGDASDFLFAIVKRGRTNLSDLSANLGSIVSTAKASGMSVEDMGASVALLTRATGQTEMALTALRAISGTFLKPGVEGAKLWKEKFGDAMDANTLKTLGMSGVLERLSKLDPGDVAKIFPNMRAIRGIFPAIEKMEGFGEDLKGMADRGGNVAEAFEKIKGPLFYWNQGMQQAKNILLEIGKALAEAIVPYIEPIKKIGKAVETWVKNNKGLVLAIGAVAGALIIGGTALATFGFLVMGIGMALTALGTVIGALGAVIGVLGTVVGAVLSPVGLLIAAVVGGVVAWVKFSESGQRAFASLKAGVLPIIETLKAAFGGIKDALMSGNWDLAGKIAMAGLKLAVLQGLAAIQKAFPETFRAVFVGVGKILDGIVKLFGKALGVLKDQWNAWGKKVLDTVLQVASKVVGVWQKAVSGMANWMLETSAKGGVMGKAMSKVLGVDMSEEQARGELAEREGRQVRLRVHEETAEELEQRIETGTDKDTGERLSPQQIEASKKLLEDTRAKIADLKAGGSGTADNAPVDVLDDAKKDVERITEQWEEEAKAGLAAAGIAADEFMQGLPENLTSDMASAIDDFVDRLASGESIEDAAKELAALREKAAKAEEKKAFAPGKMQGGPVGPVAPGAPAAPGAPVAPTAAPSGVALTATYSAAAASIAGYQPAGQGPEEKMAKSIYDMAQELKENNMLARDANVSRQYVVALYERFLAGFQVA